MYHHYIGGNDEGIASTMHLTLKKWYPYGDQIIVTLPQQTIIATFRPIKLWKYHYWAYRYDNPGHFIWQSPYCTLAIRKK